MKKNCFWITKGIVQTTIGEAFTIVDFGDGSCDNLAVSVDEEGIEGEFETKMKIHKTHRKNFLNNNSTTG